MRFVVRVTGLGLILAYAVGWGLHYLYLPGVAPEHGGHPADASHHGAAVARPEHTSHSLADYLRDSTLAAPFVIGLVLIAALAVERILARQGIAADSGAAKLTFTAAVALTAPAGRAAEALVQGWSFGLATLRYTFALTLVLTLLFGVPWRGLDRQPIKTGELVS